MNKSIFTQYYTDHFSTRLSVAQQAFFVQRLAFLIRAGIPILESLTILNEQTKNGSVKHILEHAILSVSHGVSLSVSLLRFKNVFGSTSLHIVAIGESTGQISECLEYLSVELKKKNELRKRILSAFLYPCILLVATLCIITFLIVYLFPKIIPVFLSMHIELPLSTRILLAINYFFSQYGIAALVCVMLVTFISIFFYKKNVGFKKFCTLILFQVPVFGNLIKYYNLANMSRTIALLIRSGQTLADAFPIVIEGTENIIYKNSFIVLSAQLQKGERLSVLLQKAPHLFPSTMYQIISVGEKSGGVEQSFTYIHELYESELHDVTKNLSQLIEPFLMLVIGLLVGFIAVSIISPIYGITQNIK